MEDVSTVDWSVDTEISDLEFLQESGLIDANCKYCYGRGSEGFNTRTGFIVCRCVSKALVKDGSRSVEEFLQRRAEAV